MDAAHGGAEGAWARPTAPAERWHERAGDAGVITPAEPAPPVAVDIITPHTTDSHEMETPWPNSHLAKHVHLPEFEPVSPAIRDFASSLSQPYCSSHAMVDTASLFGESAPHLRSFSYVPLRDENVFGLLALASEDAQRFYPDMGTLYLKRIGELVSAALLIHIGA